MTSGLLTQQDVDYHRDQIWTVLEDRDLAVRPGESGNVNDVLGFVLSRIGTHAQAANFETTYTVVCSCANCGHSSELPRQSETCFEADTDPALATGVDRLSATLYGVSTTQECPSCEHIRRHCYLRPVRCASTVPTGTSKYYPDDSSDLCC